jgi:hypothetical protein
VRDGATGTLYCLVTGMRSGSTFTPRGGVWRSSNGGDTWQEITGARFAWPTDVAVADANTIYVSVSAAPGFSQDGVWKTTNGGINWTQVLTGSQMGYWHTPGYTHALTVKVHPDNPNIVYCGTVDHGLWVSTDAGTTWNPFSNIPFQAPTNVAFDPLDRTKIYVTTFGGGVWKGYYLPLLPGDANSDGKVSFADYLLLEGNFGRTGTTWAQGDFNADGKVSFADYLILESSFGQSVTSPAPVSSMTATAPPAATAAPAPLSAGTAVRVTAGSAEQARRFVVSSPSALAAAARQAKPLASAGIQSSLSESRLASTVRRSLRSDL